MPSYYDTLIRGGMVFIGDGRAGFRADLAISSGKISRIGDLTDSKAETEIAADGLVVAPGFIDLHSHTDLFLPQVPTADSLVHQGVTTAVTGQCGLSPAPLGDGDCRQTSMLFGKRLNHIGDDMPYSKCATLAGYLEHLTQIGLSINIAPLVGQGILRAAVMGFQPGPPDTGQKAAIRGLAQEAMDQGAFGISSGLIYPPGCWSDKEELVDVVKAVAAKGGRYFTHIRDEGDRLFESINEALEIGRRCQIHTQICHFKAAGKANWDKSAPGLELLERAAREQPLGTDMYPYTSGATALMALLPEWALQGGQARILDRLADPETRGRMAGEMKSGGLVDGDFKRVMIIQSQTRPEYLGQRVSQLAAREGRSPQEWIMDALLRTRGDLMMAVFMMSEENRRREITHPLMAMGTDGFGLSATVLANELPAHPRSFGTFPRVLGHYCRQEGLLSLEEAVYKMTGLPASYLGLKDRGIIREGLSADITIFNPQTVIDTATYEKPNFYPVGIEYVLVGGRTVVSRGKHTGARPGQVLKRN